GGMGSAGRGAASALRLQSGSALAAPNTAVYFKKSRRCISFPYSQQASYQHKPSPCGKVKRAGDNKDRRTNPGMLTFNFDCSPVDVMKKFLQLMCLSTLLTWSASSLALTESEAEDMADLTAVFVFLKND